jgi:hypothetical protein
MKNMQSVEGDLSQLESQQNVAVTDFITSSSTENCDAVNGNDVLISAVGKEKRKKKNRRKERKSKVMNSENGYVFLRSHIDISYVDTDVVTFLEAQMQTVCMIMLQIVIP